MNMVPEIMSEIDYRAQFENILESARTKLEWMNKERFKLREFRSRLGSPAEVAKILDISVATVYAWEKQTEPDQPLAPPPARKLGKLLQLLEGKTKNEDVELLTAIRNVPYLFECGRFCEAFWTFRAGKPFVALNDSKMMDSIVDFLKKTNSAPSYLVFPTYESEPGSHQSKEKFTDAKVSCDGLMAKLRQKLEDSGNAKLLNRMRPIEISGKDALNLGLADSWNAFAMAEYGPTGYARYGKSVDVWIEFAFDVTRDPQSEKKEYRRWLELPREQAESWRERRQPFLNKWRARFSGQR